MGDGDAQPLQSAVGMDDRTLLLGVRLRREDDVGVLEDAVGEHRGVGDDEAGVVQRTVPQAAVGEIPHGIRLEQVERGELAGGGGRADLRC
jgi:hypothetical protein